MMMFLLLVSGGVMEVTAADNNNSNNIFQQEETGQGIVMDPSSSSPLSSVLGNVTITYVEYNRSELFLQRLIIDDDLCSGGRSSRPPGRLVEVVSGLDTLKVTKNGNVAFVGLRSRMLNDTTIVNNNNNTEEEDDAFLKQVWTYDITDNPPQQHFRCLCEYNDNQSTSVPEHFFLLGDKVFFRGYYKGSTRLMSCPTTSSTNKTATTATTPQQPQILFPKIGDDRLDISQLVLFQEKNLFFLGFEPYSNSSTTSLFVSDGTRNGTRKFFQQEVRGIQTNAPGNYQYFTGDIQPLVPGMPVLPFRVENQGIWVIEEKEDGEEQLEAKPFRSDIDFVREISEDFNGGLYVFFSGTSSSPINDTLMVTDWKNDTRILLNSFRLESSQKLNETHMILKGSYQQREANQPAILITDGTDNGTNPLYLMNTSAFRVLTLGPRFEAAAGAGGQKKKSLVSYTVAGNRDENGTRIVKRYITDGTQEGTIEDKRIFPPVQSKIQAQTYLVDGRILSVVERNDTLQQFTRLVLVDYLSGDRQYIENVPMPTGHGEDDDRDGLYRFMYPIGNNTILFFHHTNEKGWTPWTIQYHPRADTATSATSANNNNHTLVSNETTTVPTMGPSLQQQPAEGATLIPTTADPFTVVLDEPGADNMQQQQSNETSSSSSLTTSPTLYRSNCCWGLLSWFVAVLLFT